MWKGRINICNSNHVPGHTCAFLVQQFKRANPQIWENFMWILFITFSNPFSQSSINQCDLLLIEWRFILTQSVYHLEKPGKSRIIREFNSTWKKTVTGNFGHNQGNYFGLVINGRICRFCDIKSFQSKKAIAIETIFCT